MTMELEQRKKLVGQLYQRHGKPLRDQHLGEYVAISPVGQTVVGGDLRQVLANARATLGPGSFVFKVGERAVWHLR